MPTTKPWLRRSDSDGYLALALTAFLFLIPFLPEAVEPFEIPLGLVVLGAVVRCAVRGITRGRGGGKRAAKLSLIALVLMFLACISVTYIELTRIMSEAGNR